MGAETVEGSATVGGVCGGTVSCTANGAELPLGGSRGTEGRGDILDEHVHPCDRAVSCPVSSEVEARRNAPFPGKEGLAVWPLAQLS